MGMIKQLIAAGADVHACDDIGQNLMHEIARYHGAEVCFFFLNYSVNINLGEEEAICCIVLLGNMRRRQSAVSYF